VAKALRELTQLRVVWRPMELRAVEGSSLDLVWDNHQAQVALPPAQQTRKNDV